MCVFVCECVILSLAPAKIGCDFGESTERNITASSGKLHLAKCVCVCVLYAHIHAQGSAAHSVDLSSLNVDLNAVRGRNR